MITKPNNPLGKSLVALLPLDRRLTTGEELWSIVEKALLDPLARPIASMMVEGKKRAINERLPFGIEYSFHPGLPRSSFTIHANLGYPDKEVALHAPLRGEEHLLNLNTQFKELGPGDWDTLQYFLERTTRLLDRVEPPWAIIDLFDRFPFGKEESVLSDVHWLRYYPRADEAEARRLEPHGAIAKETRTGLLVRYWKDPFDPPDRREAARLRALIDN